MLNQFLIIMNIISLHRGTYITYMNEDQQIQKNAITISLNQFQNENSQLSYGLWSQYIPLSTIMPVGKIGIFDSNCYNLHNVLDSSTEKSNFLYYDCINFEQKTIKKIIQFVDDQEEQHTFQLDIDYQNYENIWFYFGISLWPLRNICQLLIIQFPDIILFTNINIVFPFYDLSLQITFGGDLQLLSQSRVQTLNQNLVFSYFPGKMFLYPATFNQYYFDINSAHQDAISIFSRFAYCQCSFNMNAQFSDEIINFVSYESISSLSPNCDSFSLTGWIKAIDIHQSDSEFLYKFIKVSADTGNEKLTIDDLSPFQLLYRFQNSKQYLQIWTYSYTFPSVYLDFSQNPFLIKKEIELDKSITLWHFLSATLDGNQFQFEITFFEGQNSYSQNFGFSVNHFHKVQLKIELGNLFGDANNYLDMRIVSFYLLPCLTIIPQRSCDQSCETCDGPTSNNCLSCSADSNKIYLADSKSCVCPYNSLDEFYQCLDINALQFSLVSIQKDKYQCQYGYFQYDKQQCVQCPSNPQSNSIACIECIQNPLTWNSQSVCQTDIKFNLTDTLVYTQTKDYNIRFFVYDSDNLKYCQNCQRQNIFDTDQIYQDLQQTQNPENYFCLKYQRMSNSQCAKCNIPYCTLCETTINQGLKCVQCDTFSTLRNGQCEGNDESDIPQNFCLSPNYVTSTNQCVLCTIENCKYCFEYEKNDLSKNTLFKSFQTFQIDEFHSIGCALCEEGFKFNAVDGKCVYEEQKILNCLRSFINLQGVEVCTLSDSFDLSPEIVNCGNIILNCQQCIQTPSQRILCIVCNDGFTTNISTGQCSICQILNSKKCIQGDQNLYDGWVQLVQGFIMQFLDSNYYYPKPTVSHWITEFIISCQDGYQPTITNKCALYCSSECLKCVSQAGPPYGFKCLECPLNYYNQPIRSLDTVNCIKCPILCAICQYRNNDQIEALNPYFTVTSQNIQYTSQCIQLAFTENVIIDPISQIAKYVFDSIENILNFNVILNCDQLWYVVSATWSSYYFQNQINSDYCNQMGITTIQITFKYIQAPQMGCLFSNPTVFLTSLTRQIFSLNSIIFKFIGFNQYKNNKFSDSLMTQNFDQIQISHIYFELVGNMYFWFQNNENPIKMMLQDLQFYSVQGAIQFSVKNTLFKQLILSNLTFFNLNITNSIIFNISGLYFNEEIKISNILIQYCVFTNSTFLQLLQNSINIVMENITIENSYFFNSTFLLLHSNVSTQTKGQLKQFRFFNNEFYSSNQILMQNFEQIFIEEIYINFNFFLSSTLITTNSNLMMNSINAIQNSLVNSSIFLSLSNLFGTQIIYQFDSISFQNNQLQESISFYIAPQYSVKEQKFIILLNQCIFIKNEGIAFLYQEPFLFKIQCDTLQLAHIQIYEQYSISFIYIYETNSIKINDATLENKLNRKIQQEQDCLNKEMYLQFLKIFGFQNVFLQDISITGLFFYDSSAFQFISNILYNPDQLENIQLENITLTENMLLKFSLGKRISLIQIYSEKTQVLIFKEITFLNNLFHQTVDDPSDTQAGLIYVNSQLSNISISDIISNYNGITNSSCSFLFFIVNSLSIFNYTIESLNILNESLLQNYFESNEFFDQKTQQEIQMIAQSILSIQTKGCVCSATISSLQIIEGVFNNILSQTSALFDLKTQGQGQILFKNLIISNIDVIYDSNVDLQGSITIYSQNSLLNLQLIDIQFIDVQSKFSPSILQIIPSQRHNTIILKNVIIKDCQSLQNSIIKVEFSQQKLNQNFVSFKNVSITFTEQGWKNYFSKLELIGITDLEKIMNDNALISLMSCSLMIEKLFVSGILISPILKIIDSQIFSIKDSQFFSISTFYSMNLIQVNQNKYNSMKIAFYQIKFQGIQLHQPNTDSILEQLQLNKISFESKCLIAIKNVTYNKISYSYLEIINLFQNTINEGSIIWLQSLYNLTKIYIQSINVIENNCSFCDQGLIFIEAQQIQTLKLTEINCIKNSIKQYGCINIDSNGQYQNEFTLKASVLALNNGFNGTGISFSNLKGIIKECLIFNNSAKNFGGGIFANIENNDFLFKNTKIIQNNAVEGGGLMFSGFSNLNGSNFISSYLKFNKANILANNLIETPTHLALVINNFEMNSNQQETDNLTSDTLIISPYTISQQDIFVQTDFLMLPSNQKIIEYQIFDQNIQKFKHYITEISLNLKNSVNEKLGNYNLNCSVFQNILQINGSLIKQKLAFTVDFDKLLNKIDLGGLYFAFDPYTTSEQIQQIEIFCQMSQEKTLSYKFNTKAFLCQLGEFYANNGCQICESSYGFYSVTYNATKCSIFDKTKFSNITSNTISLLPGFWRSNMLSDNPELCFKETLFCLGGWEVNDKSCLNGHIGGLCEECDIYNIRGQGYFYKNTQNVGCLLCNDSKSSIVLFTFIFLLAIFSILITLRSIDKTNALFTSLKLKEKFGKIIFKLNQDHQSFLIKMFLSYLWIFSVIFTYNISFSINLNMIDQVSNTSYFMANNLDCYLSEIQIANLIYVRIIATMIFILIQLLLVYLIFYVVSKISKSKFDSSNISNTGLYLYISNHAALTKQFCSLIAIRTISNIDFVQGNVALQFYSYSHLRWIYYFVLPGLGLNGCLIPFLIFSILFVRRKKLDQIQIRKHICYLFNEYNENSYYWEQIKIWQKTLIILIMTYFESEVLLKTTLLGLSLLLYQLIAIQIKPYIISNLNNLDIETGQLCLIAIFLAAARSESVQQNNAGASNLLQIIIVFLCLFLIYLYFSNIVRVYVLKYKILALQVIYSTFKSISPDSQITKYFEEMYFLEKQRKDKLKANYDKLKAHLMTSSKFGVQRQVTSIFTPQQTLRGGVVSQENESVKLFVVGSNQI